MYNAGDLQIKNSPEYIKIGITVRKQLCVIGNMFNFACIFKFVCIFCLPLPQVNAHLWPQPIGDNAWLTLCPSLWDVNLVFLFFFFLLTITLPGKRQQWNDIVVDFRLQPCHLHYCYVNTQWRERERESTREREAQVCLGFFLLASIYKIFS